MSNPHVPIDPDLESAMVEARVDRWLDPDPLTPTELDHAYALGFEDGWDSTKPRPHRSRLELVVLVGAIAALVIVGQLRPADRRPASGDDRVLGRAHAAGDRDRAVNGAMRASSRRGSSRHSEATTSSVGARSASPATPTSCSSWRVPDRPLDPFEAAVAFALREAARRRAEEEAERRRTMTVVDGGKRGGQAA